VTIGTGDLKRASAAPTELDRDRALATIRRCGMEGLLSTREVEERIEEAFRARTVAQLRSLLASLPYSPHVSAEVVLSHGLAPAASKSNAPWWRGILAWSLALDVLWVVIWLVTGGAVGWLVLAIATTMTAFTFRLSRRYRRQLTGKPPRRRFL